MVTPSPIESVPQQVVLNEVNLGRNGLVADSWWRGVQQSWIARMFLRSEIVTVQIVDGGLVHPRGT